MYLDSNNIEKYLKRLDENSFPKWGTLNPSQMLFHCTSFLKESLDIIRPKVVVTLGTVALNAINQILSTRFQLSQNVAQSISMPDFKLFPLYHPSPRVTNWKRPMAQQKKDFSKIPI